MTGAVDVGAAHLERAASLLGRSQKIDLTLLQHVSPLGWEHVGLTGDYLWRTDKRLAKGGYRTLRPPAARLSGS